jgi:hypothetical protein
VTFDRSLSKFIQTIHSNFSPLTANIYFPAIPTLAIAFNKPTELINLTVRFSEITKYDYSI